MNPTTREFYKIADAHWEETFAHFPTVASALGRHEFDGELGRADPATHQRQARSVARALAAVENLPEHHFDGDAWLDRRAFLADLRTEIIFGDELQTWRTNPNRHAEAAVDSVHHLVVRHADDLRPVAAAVISRLKKLPAWLDEAAACIRQPVPLWMKQAKETSEHVPSFFNSIVAPLEQALENVGGASAPRPFGKKLESGRSGPSHIPELIADANAAFARYAKAIGGKRPGPARGYSVGRERFARLIRERCGFDRSAAECEAIGEAMVRQLREELARECRKFSSKKSADEIIADARKSWSPKSGDLLTEYQRVTFEMRDAFVAKKAMTFPRGDRLLVKPVPEFMRHLIATAAYSSPGPFDRNQTGIFWVNDLSKTKETAGEKRAEVQQHFGLELTAAHEAYPGHHLQFVLANKHPSKLRRLFAHATFFEGWTLWCEQMCVDLGIYRAPTARLAQLHDALWRANRILIDVRLQTGRYSYEDAVRHLVRHVGFTEARAQADVNWYSSSPTTPMSYLLGKLEVLRLHRQRVIEGGWSLHRFNDWLLSHGTVPQRWIEQAERN